VRRYGYALSTTSVGDGAAIDPGLYREVMGHYPTGVAVVTALDSGGPVGMVVGTFSAVSLDPPLVAFMPTLKSGTYARLSSSSAYCINVLAHDQLGLCRKMATPRDDKFDEVTWTKSPLGAPALTDAVAHVHCVVHSILGAGDHLIVLCTVTGMEVVRPVTPLLFFQGGYGGFSPRGMTAKGDASIIAAIHLADPARPYIEKLAAQWGCETAVLVAVGDDEMTTAASAYGGDATMRNRLGDRIPLIPPMGEAYFAGQSPEAVDRWLSSTSSLDPGAIDRYRDRVRAIREGGAAIAMIAPGGEQAYRQFHDALHEYTSTELTPARERALRQAIEDASWLLHGDLSDDHLYDVGSVSVPVHNPEGDVSMVLRMAQLPPRADRSRVEQWIDALQTAARRVERDLDSPTGSTQLGAYRDWYMAEIPR
jgi:flavin reductase (DIM6/NTAB) family NADH-FMN oxidoreductase RutF/DNA-binding IclR family transcriptional regulator